VLNLACYGVAPAAVGKLTGSGAVQPVAVEREILGSRTAAYRIQGIGVKPLSNNHTSTGSSASNGRQMRSTPAKAGIRHGVAGRAGATPERLPAVLISGRA